MFRTTPIALKTSNYFRRSPHAITNFNRRRWRPPRRPHTTSFVANRTKPMSYKNPNTRSGIDWYNRLKHRGIYKNYPFARWIDDPIHHHQDPDRAPSRMLSVRDAAPHVGVPQWDYYAATGRDYDTPTSAPPTFMAKFISLFAGKVWSRSQMESYLAALEPHWPTIGDVHDNAAEIEQWNTNEAALPPGLLQHVLLLAADITQQNETKLAREVMHASGRLRNHKMKRYYALPYHYGPAVPEKLKQPVGKYPEGEYLTMMERKKYYHPLQKMDGRKTTQLHPL